MTPSFAAAGGARRGPPAAPPPGLRRGRRPSARGRLPGRPSAAARPTFAGETHTLVGGRRQGVFVELAAVQAVSVSPVPPAGEDCGGRRRARVQRVVWTCAMAVLVGVTIEGGSSAPYLVLDIAVGAV